MPETEKARTARKAQFELVKAQLTRAEIKALHKAAARAARKELQTLEDRAIFAKVEAIRRSLRTRR